MSWEDEQADMEAQQLLADRYTRNYTETAVITYTDEDTGTVFRWHGGAYIEVGFWTVEEEHGLGAESHYIAEDVINVWDDALNISRLERFAEGTSRPFRFILEEFERMCQQYLTEAMAEADR